MWRSRLRSYTRRLAAVALLAASAASLGGFTEGRTARGAFKDAPPPRVVAAGAGITIRLPHGWLLVGGRLSDVVEPAPRLAIASFPVKLSRHECACGMPNPVAFPRNGAFLFVWEYLGLTRGQLQRVPQRPRRFTLQGTGPIQGYECAGPSGTLVFSDGGREFQAEIYLGAGVTPAIRAQLISALDSFSASKRPRGTPGSRR